jgi:hypothetical protein
MDETRNYSTSVMATFLFRKGTQANEKDFSPDKDLIREMLKRNIRVQDLLTCNNDPEIHELVDWYYDKSKKKKGK